MNINIKDFKDPLNLLVLLGFVCQGFTWENALGPALFSVLWLLCMLSKSQNRLVPEILELLIFVLAFLLSLQLGGYGAGTRFSYYYGKTMAIGNSLLILQAIRLLRHQSKREKLFSCAMSVTLLAIGSNFMVDYPFILVLAIAIVLIPKTLNHTTQEGYCHFKPFRLMDNKGIYLLLIVLMAIFFIVFPRNRIFATYGMGAMMSARGAIQPELDPSFGGTETPDTVLFRVEGDEIGFLKSYSLDEFDGGIWKASKWSNQARPAIKGIALESCKSRKVKVYNTTNLGNSLPCDGYVVAVRGNFFQGAFVRVQDTIAVSSLWSTKNNEYEYWMRDDLSAPPVKNELERCLVYPAQSKELQNWLNNVLDNEKAPEKITMKIEKALQEECVYEIGVPNLSSPTAIEDFILKDKKGHCGRFASAAAMLLRMASIPSRVGIGYMPGEKNQFANFYNIRSGDAHAWAEAYVEGSGWRIVDATSATQSRTTASSAANFALSAKDWLEFIWYSKIVNFSTNDQRSIASYTFSVVDEAKAYLPGKLASILVSALLLAAAVFIFKFRRRIKNMLSILVKRRSGIVEATHFYGVMLGLLAKEKLIRDDCETPLEFLGRIERESHAKSAQIRLLTEIFCNIKYGGSILGEPDRRRIHEALREIKFNHPPR